MPSSRSKSLSRRSSDKDSLWKEFPSPPNKSRNSKVKPNRPLPKRVSPKPKKGNVEREHQQRGKDYSVSGTDRYRDESEARTEKSCEHCPSVEESGYGHRKSGSSDSSSGEGRSLTKPSSSSRKNMTTAKSCDFPESMCGYLSGAPDWGVQISRYGEVHIGIGGGTSAAVSIKSGEVSVVGRQEGSCRSSSHSL